MTKEPKDLKALRIHLELFRKILKEAFDNKTKGVEELSDLLPSPNPLCHAVLANNYILDIARKYSESNQYEVIKEGNSNFLVLKDQNQNVIIKAKFKKLDKYSYKPSNIPTQSSLNFLNNKVDVPFNYSLEFADEPDIITIIIGYVPNETRTEARFYVMRPADEHSIEWVLPIGDTSNNEISKDSFKDVVPQYIIPRKKPILKTKQKKEKNAI